MQIKRLWFTKYIFVLLIFLAIFLSTIFFSWIFFKKDLPISQLIPFIDLSRGFCDKCNVILISLDTLRADELPCYGYRRNTAPNLCKFAEKNILFKNFSSQSSHTLPSHTSIFTSLYPYQHKVLIPFKDVLNPNIITLPQILKENGYFTIYVGPAKDPTLPLDKGLGRGFDLIIKNNEKDIEKWQLGYKKLVENIKKNKPTFLFLHTYFIHAPYLTGDNERHLFTSEVFGNIPLSEEEYEEFTEELFSIAIEEFESRLKSGGPPESQERSKGLLDRLNNTKDSDKLKAIIESLPGYERNALYYKRYFNRININNSKQIDFLRALYDELIFQLDEKLASLLSFLDNQDLYKNTIVIITSDHGEEFGEHGNLSHENSIYNTSTYVPLIMSIPNIKEREISDLSQSIDIYPTILGSVGIKAPLWLEGIDLTGVLLKKKDAPTNKYVIGEKKDRTVFSIRDKKWKLYLNRNNSKESIELYDIVDDPLEQDNAASKNQEIVDRLKLELERVLKKESPFEEVEADFPDWIDTKKREKLIKEGYF